jgi:hypothetical protein
LIAEIPGTSGAATMLEPHQLRVDQWKWCAMKAISSYSHCTG